VDGSHPAREGHSLEREATTDDIAHDSMLADDRSSGAFDRW
jgi:hypothetical protein